MVGLRNNNRIALDNSRDEIGRLDSEGHLAEVFSRLGYVFTGMKQTSDKEDMTDSVDAWVTLEEGYGRSSQASLEFRGREWQHVQNYWEITQEHRKLLDTAKYRYFIYYAIDGHPDGKFRLILLIDGPMLRDLYYEEPFIFGSFPDGKGEYPKTLDIDIARQRGILLAELHYADGR
jgi:hypothetical protein